MWVPLGVDSLFFQSKSMNNLRNYIIQRVLTKHTNGSFLSTLSGEHDTLIVGHHTASDDNISLWKVTPKIRELDANDDEELDSNEIDLELIRSFSGYSEAPLCHVIWHYFDDHGKKKSILISALGTYIRFSAFDDGTWLYGIPKAHKDRIGSMCIYKGNILVSADYSGVIQFWHLSYNYPIWEAKQGVHCFIYKPVITMHNHEDRYIIVATKSGVSHLSLDRASDKPSLYVVAETSESPQAITFLKDSLVIALESKIISYETNHRVQRANHSAHSLVIWREHLVGVRQQDDCSIITLYALGGEDNIKIYQSQPYVKISTMYVLQNVLFAVEASSVLAWKRMK